MKSLKFYQLLLLFGVLLTASCSDDPQDDINGLKPIFSQYYVRCYLSGDLDIAKSSDDSYWLIRPSKGAARVYFTDVNSPGYAQFKRLALANNDTNYNDYVSGDAGAHAFADNFSAIHITSDKDWDAEHPAGTLLNDIVIIDAVSYASFIRSGYKGRSPELLCKHASELAVDDLYILHCSYDSLFGFWFDKAPVEAGVEHALTITLITAAGEERTMTYTGVPPVMD